MKRNVVLRSNPSPSAKKLATLTPPERLQVISLAVRNGFRHIATKDGDKGWVWSNNVAVQDEGDANKQATADSDLLAKLVAAHSGSGWAAVSHRPDFLYM